MRSIILIIGLVAVAAVAAFAWVVQRLSPATRGWLFGSVATIGFISAMLLWFSVSEDYPEHSGTLNAATPVTGGIALDSPVAVRQPNYGPPQGDLLSAKPAKAEAEASGDHQLTNSLAPQWINDAPGNRGDAFFVVVKSGQVSDEAMRKELLGVKMVAAARRYIDEIQHPGLSVAGAVELDPAFLRDHCVVSEYTAAQNGEVENYIQLKFDRKFRSEVDRRYKQYVSTSRVEQLGGVTLGVLGVLAAALAVLKFTKPRDDGIQRSK